MFDPLCSSPPQNLDAEKLVLGLALCEPGGAKRLVSELSPRDFVISPHQHICQVIRELVEADREVCGVLVCDELERRGKLEAAGGPEYIASLDSGLGRIFGGDEYYRIVRDKSSMRQLLFGVQKIAHQCYGDSPADVLAEAESLLRSVSEKISDGRRGGLRPAREIIAETGGPAALFEAATRGLQTPWDALNRLTLGMHRGQMIVLAGRTGRGKSAAATQIAAYALRQRAGAVAVFSLEMPGAGIIRRMACAEASVSATLVRRGDATAAQLAALEHTASGFGEQELYISERMQVTVGAVRREIERLRGRGPVALAVVDYLQLMAGSGRAENRQTEIAAISRGLKGAAVEFGIPLLVLCQYNREADKGDVRPGLQHLRESGAIAHDADTVWLMHEPEGMREQGWTTELIVEKQREGPTGSVRLWFDRQKTKFAGDECGS